MAANSDSIIPEIEEIETLIIDTRSVGQTGLNRSVGIILEETLPQLEGQRGMKTFRDMVDNDSVVSSIVFMITQLARTVEWYVESPGSHPAHQRAADHLEECMHDMEKTWVDTIAEMMTFAFYGFSLHEKVYKWRMGNDSRKSHRSKFRDNRLGWRYLPIRGQDTIIRWHFDRSGDIISVEQQSPPNWGFVRIDYNRLLHFRAFNYKDNPVGKSIFRGAYEPWYMRRAITRLEGIGVERDLTGLPAMGVPSALLHPNAPLKQKQLKAHFERMLRNVRQDSAAAVMYPNDKDENGNLVYEFKLMASPGAKQFDTDKIVQRHKTDIAMNCLADFMLLGNSSGSTGSWSMHADKTKLFVRALGGFLDVIRDELNRNAVPELMRLNGFSDVECPRIGHSDLDRVDLKDLGAFLVQLSQTGMQLFPNMELEKAIMKAAGLPAPTEAQTSGEGPNSAPQPQPIPQRVVQIDDPEEKQQPEAGAPANAEADPLDAPGARVTRGKNLDPNRSTYRPDMPVMPKKPLFGV